MAPGLPRPTMAAGVGMPPEAKGRLMDLVAIALLVTAGAAAAPSAPANALAAELIHDGVAMSDGSRLKLPPPTLADSLDAAGQRAAIAKLLEGTGHAPDELTRNSYQAPFVLNVRTVRGGNPKAPGARSTSGSSPMATGPLPLRRNFSTASGRLQRPEATIRSRRDMPCSPPPNSPSARSNPAPRPAPTSATSSVPRTSSTAST